MATVQFISLGYSRQSTNILAIVASHDRCHNLLIRPASGIRSRGPLADRRTETALFWNSPQAPSRVAAGAARTKPLTPEARGLTSKRSQPARRVSPRMTPPKRSGVADRLGIGDGIPLSPRFCPE